MNISEKEREEKLYRQVHQQAELPEIVVRKIDEAYKKIEAGQIRQEKAPGHWLKRTAACIGAAAAVLAVVCTFVLVNPVMARELPLVGGLFGFLQDKVSFFGDFSGKATVLENTASQADAAADTQNAGQGAKGSAKSSAKSSASAYTQTDAGLTVTFSEVYANDQVIYLTMLAKSEEPFPDTAVRENEDGQGSPVIHFIMEKNYSFLKKDAQGMGYASPEGRFLDANTYSCILRLELAEDAKDDTQYQQQYEALSNEIMEEMGVTESEINGPAAQSYALLEEYNEKLLQRSGALQAYITQAEIPDHFQLQLQLSEFIGIRPDNGKYTYEGNWAFEIPVSVDKSQTVTLELNSTNTDGVGIASVIKTPYELTINELYAEGSDSDTFMVALDAQGNKLPSIVSSASANSFAVQDRDISTVDIYILDYEEYVNELKGEEYFYNNETKPEKEKWGTILGQHAKYHTAVHF